MKIDNPAMEQLPSLRRLWQLSFGDDDAFLDLFFSTAFSPDRCRCMIANGQAAAALYWFDVRCRGQKLAYLYAVATHPDNRGQGLCRALMADTHALLAAQGYQGALLVPEGDRLRAMYTKLGYRDCTTISEFSCAPGAAPVALQAVAPEEYACLRRRFLPEGGVLQEGACLDFLSPQADFYAGPDFLLAAVQENRMLHGIELLGNAEAAPGILSALGCTQGRFRTPGTGHPFAMFLPLSQTALPPAYFGLAFD